MHYLCWDLWTLKHAMREIIEGKGGEKQKSLRTPVFNFALKTYNIETSHGSLQIEVAISTLSPAHILAFSTWIRFSNQC